MSSASPGQMMRRVGHTALTYDPEVYQVIRAELDAARDLWRERDEG